MRVFVVAQMISARVLERNVVNSDEPWNEVDRSTVPVLPGTRPMWRTLRPGVRGPLHTVALDQSALLEVLAALKGGDVEERVPQAATTIDQALIGAELSQTYVRGWMGSADRVLPSGYVAGSRLFTLGSPVFGRTATRHF